MIKSKEIIMCSLERVKIEKKEKSHIESQVKVMT